MGTRAQFFIGHPSNLAEREWLGCVAFDGYPDGDIGDAFDGVSDIASFRAAVDKIALARTDFCDPATMSFPFPWRYDLYLTDCTYAWFEGAVQFTPYHRGFRTLNDELADDGEGDEPSFEALPGNVPAPSDETKPAGPDSIMILGLRS